ncbi:glycosyltransferase family 4 protein [Streptomyces sp. NPDC088752]|uniref:glycosyltransferase family 4 protein n=1 Tax=Streptomyces sp. NPDC088752 TaxID=3154963 RepID=UPI00342C2EC0
MEQPPSVAAVRDGSRAPGGARKEHDPFVEARTTYWNRLLGGGNPCDSHGFGSYPRSLLEELVGAEYRPDHRARARFGVTTSGDLVLAGLRHRIRTGEVPDPDECVRLLTGSESVRAVLFESWSATVRRYGAAWTTAAVRSGLHVTRDPNAVAFLLDAAAAADLRPLPPLELLRFASGHGRRVAHAARRLLATYGHRPSLATVGHDPADAYERLLLDALEQRPLTGTGTAGGRPGLFVAQSMLMGRFDRPGEGLSGGLGVLLGSLGDALARTDGIAAVVTMVTACRPELEEDPTLLRRRSSGHWILRLPLDSDRPVRPEEMGPHREALAWWATRLLGALPRPVDVLHVRYADDGSLALAESARRVGAALVFTATPDPHRQMGERHGAPDADPGHVRHDLHRVFLADRLVERADRVVGIAGRAGGTDELLRHFPQLAEQVGGTTPIALPEGVAPYQPPPDEERRRELLLGAVDAVASACADRVPTVLLNVGRLHPIKQQDVLVRAWVESGCYRDSILVIVGGSPRRGDAVERSMHERIEEAVASCPEARRRLLLLPALPNPEVRLLERALALPTRPLRARYVCSSAKEEFGLAVLEAMEAGLVTAGPVRGGVPHYLEDGENGLLIDTSTSRSLGRGLERLLRIGDEEAAVMASRARCLIRTTYSAAAMARAMAGQYADVTGGEGRSDEGGTAVLPSRIRIPS